jgi:hypothetical protein
MRMRHLPVWIALLVAVGGLGSFVAADDESERADAGSAEASTTPPVGARPPAAPPPVFVPPNRGAPATRLGGATRGSGGPELPAIEALVPEEAGWTLEEQPVLYWYLSSPTDVRTDLRIVGVEPLEPILQTTLPRAEQGGVQRVRLADHGVRLETGRLYQWLVMLVPDPEDASYNRVVGGGIQRIETPPDLEARLRDTEPAQLPHTLARAGIWYDAIDVLSTRIEDSRGDPTIWWNQRAALFQQVGLPDVPLEKHAAAGFDQR